MNDICQHDEYVRLNLSDRTAARALVDHHEEAFGVSRRIALRAVAVMRRQWRKDESQRRADALVRHALAKKTPLLRLLRFYSRDFHSDWADVTVISGWRIPRAEVSYMEIGDDTFTRATCTVGARFVLMLEALLRRNEWSIAKLNVHRLALEEDGR